VIKLNIENILIGIVGGLLYALLGYAASKEDFNPKKFLRTFVIVSVCSLGLDISELNGNVYAGFLGPTAITVWLQKLIDSVRVKL